MGWFLAGVIILSGVIILEGIRKFRASQRAHHLRRVSQQIVTEALMNVGARFPQLQGLQEVDSQKNRGVGKCRNVI